MDIITKKYVKKPLFVDAVQVTEENFAAIARWCQGEIRNNDNERVEPTLVEEQDGAKPLSPQGLHIHVRVHAPRTPRQTKAFVGDWLLYTERGYKIYNTKAFEATFDLAEANGKVEAVTPQVVQP